MNALTKTITVTIAARTYQQLKDAAERESTTLEDFTRLAIEKAAYAASLAKYAPKEGGPYQYDAEAVAEHDADVKRLIYGDDA